MTAIRRGPLLLLSAARRVVESAWVLPVVLALCIVRLWLAPLPSSFWVDEMGTAFLVRHGAGHPSFEAAPQVPMSVYYLLPRLAQSLFGFSEIA